MSKSPKLFSALTVSAVALVAIATIASAQEPNEANISSLRMIDTFTGTSIDSYDPILNGTLIDTTLTPTNNYGIEAITNTATKSVMFSVNGHNARLETQAPYTLEIGSLTGAVHIEADAFDNSDGTGTPSATTTLGLNIGANDLTDVIRVNTANTRDGGVVLDGATIEGTDPNGSPVWIYLDTPRLYNSVEWWVNEPPDDRQTLTGQTSTNTPPYQLGGSSSPYDLVDLPTGTHSITATGLFADGQPITTTAWFTYVATGDQLEFSETEAPAVADPAPSPSPVPQASIPPITVPPIATTTTTQPPLTEGTPIEPPRILVPPEVLQPEILNAELVTLFDYARQAHLITNTDEGTRRRVVDLTCIDTILNSYGPPAFLYDSQYDIEDVQETPIEYNCERIIEIIDQHVTFPRFVSTTRNNTPARYWLLDVATPANGTPTVTHKHVIDHNCATKLTRFNGVTFTDQKWKAVSELPTIRNLDCTQATQISHAYRTVPDLDAGDDLELPVPPTPQPPDTTVAPNTGN